MSNYDNFISDFPTRCGELLREFEEPSGLQGLEVTLMLSVAATSIVIPLERLVGPKPGQQQYVPCPKCGAPVNMGKGPSSGHPSHDWQQFPEAKRKLDDLRGNSFVGSPLWPGFSAGSWSYGKIKGVSGDPDSWKELKAPNVLDGKKEVGDVLQHLRNALAHGNIFTRGQPQVEQIILLSNVAEGVPKFHFLMVEPADFRAFLDNWLAFLRDLPLPAGVVSGLAEATA